MTNETRVAEHLPNTRKFRAHTPTMLSGLTPQQPPHAALVALVPTEDANRMQAVERIQAVRVVVQTLGESTKNRRDASSEQLLQGLAQDLEDFGDFLGSDSLPVFKLRLATHVIVPYVETVAKRLQSNISKSTSSTRFSQVGF